MHQPNSNFVGETEKVIYDRTKRATDKLFTLLAAAHADKASCEIVNEMPARQTSMAVRRINRSLQCNQVDNIHRVVAAAFPGISVSDIKSPKRTASIVRPRQISMYLAWTMTKRSLIDVGRYTGGRDHTTVLHAVRKMERLSETDVELAAKINQIRATIEEMMA